jgi:hypothetical protein
MNGNKIMMHKLSRVYTARAFLDRAPHRVEFEIAGETYNLLIYQSYLAFTTIGIIALNQTTAARYAQDYHIRVRVALQCANSVAVDMPTAKGRTTSMTDHFVYDITVHTLVIEDAAKDADAHVVIDVEFWHDTSNLIKPDTAPPTMAPVDAFLAIQAAGCGTDMCLIPTEGLTHTRIPIHSAVMCTASRVFEARYKKTQVDNPADVFICVRASAVVLQCLVEYIYGRVDINATMTRVSQTNKRTADTVDADADPASIIQQWAALAGLGIEFEMPALVDLCCVNVMAHCPIVRLCDVITAFWDIKAQTPKLTTCIKNVLDAHLYLVCKTPAFATVNPVAFAAYLAP